jgi:hypothetical protein
VSCQSCPATVVPSQLSCPSSPSPAVLPQHTCFQLSCRHCPVLAVMFWPSESLCPVQDLSARPVQTVMSWLYCSSCPVPVLPRVPYWLSCPICPVLAVMFCPSSSVLAIRFCLSCSLWPVQFPLACPGCTIPTLFFRCPFQADKYRGTHLPKPQSPPDKLFW